MVMSESKFEVGQTVTIISLQETGVITHHRTKKGTTYATDYAYVVKKDSQTDDDEHPVIDEDDLELYEP